MEKFCWHIQAPYEILVIFREVASAKYAHTNALNGDYVIVNVQAARRYGMYSEAVNYTGRGRSPSHGIVNSRGRHPVLPRRLYVN